MGVYGRPEGKCVCVEEGEVNVGLAMAEGRAETRILFGVGWMVAEGTGLELTGSGGRDGRVDGAVDGRPEGWNSLTTVPLIEICKSVTGIPWVIISDFSSIELFISK